MKWFARAIIVMVTTLVIIAVGFLAYNVLGGLI